MKGRGVAVAAAAVAMLGYADCVQAADFDTMLTKAPVAKAPPGPATCTGLADFFLTACQLSAYGVRIYGTVDVGFGYQTHGAPFDKFFVTGASYFLQKMNRTPMWGIAPNGLGNSNVGVQIKEALGSGWSFVGQFDAGFDPYSLQLSSSPGSLWEQRGVPVANQNTAGDSTRAGQPWNGLGFFGFSNDTWGTLTFFRQNAFTNDAIASYDPMQGAYAFSPIGFSGLVAGGGDTEDSKYSSSVKYRVNVGNFRLGALAEFGGYEMNNGAKEAYSGTVGADFHVGPGLLSTDAIVAYNKDAVNLGLSATGVLGATISNNTNAMFVAKYALDRLKLYAGYEWMQFAAPSDNITSFTDIAGNFICAGCSAANSASPFTNITNQGPIKRILQVGWIGARYSVTDSVDVAVAYYHYDQNNFAAAGTNCGTNTFSPTSGFSINSACSGTMNAASALIDWRLAPKWDVYLGTFYSEFNGGLESGYLAHSNLATTAGLRFRF
jgi:predicted porin